MVGQVSVKTAAWPAVGSAVPAGGEVTITRPALGETWHGTITSATADGMAKVRVHSYTPKGGGKKRRMRHHVTVPAADLIPAPRRVPVRHVGERKAFDEVRHPRGHHGEFSDDGGRAGGFTPFRGWVKKGAPPGGFDETVRKANAGRAKTGVLKRAQRQQMNVGAGLAVAGGSSDLGRPVADALTRAAQTGKDHYVIPTAIGMAASTSKISTGGYIRVRPDGEVTDWRRPEGQWAPHEQVATLSDHTVSDILDTHLSKTRTAAPPVPKPAKKNPDAQWSRSAIARAIKDVDKTPELQQPDFYQRIRDVAAASGAADLIPDGWGQAPAAKTATADGFRQVHQHLSEIPGLLGAHGQIQSPSDRRLAATVGNIKDELSEGPASADWEYINGEMSKLAAAQADAARRGGAGDSSARALAARLSDLHDALASLAATHAGAAADGAGLPWDRDGDVLHYRGSLGVDRAGMPQISGTVRGQYRASSEMMPKFLDRLRGQGVTVTRERVPAATLKPTQTAGDAGIVRRIADEISRGADTKPVLVSADSRVVDGHHQWAAHALADSEGTHGAVPDGVPVIRVHLPATDLLDQTRQFAADEGIENRRTGVSANPEYATDTKHAGGQQVIATTRRRMPDGTVVTVQVKGLFDEAKHPRDRHGHWIDVGHEVHLADGSAGKITAVRSGGKVEVETGDGRRVEVAANTVSVHGADAAKPAARFRGFKPGRAPLVAATPGRPASTYVAKPAPGDTLIHPEHGHVVVQGVHRGGKVVDAHDGQRIVTLNRPAAGVWTRVAGLPRGAREPEPGVDPGNPETWTRAAPSPLTDAEYEAHRQAIEGRLKGALDAGLATDHVHTMDPARTVWTPERAAVHKEIVDKMLADAKDVPNEGKGVIAGGLGGAGKSTVLAKHAGIDTSQYMTINPDDIKEEMARRGLIPEVEGLSPMESASLVHEESSRIGNLAAQRAYDQHKNVVWDITMSSAKSADKRIADMRQAGYGDVRGVFVDIPGETSVQRAMARHRHGLEDYRAGKGFGGRYVPPEIIRQSAGTGPVSTNRAAFEQLQPKFDSWSLYDNSVHGRAPVHIASSSTAAAAA